jgi:cobalt transporter subunit CbtA
MIGRTLFAAFLAGLAAGLVMSVVQQWRVVPLIQQAEQYEGGGHSHDDGNAAATTTSGAAATGVAAAAAGGHDHGGHDHGAGSGNDHDHGAGVWSPSSDAERLRYTIIANVGAGVGFALLLAAVSLMLNVPVTPANGFLWGLAGFCVFMLAPSIGLPPELPGMPAADLHDRQLWWWATVAATAIGIVLLVLAKPVLAKLVGLAVILAPHLYGAPRIADTDSDVPAALATAFAANALATGVVFWLTLGVALGVIGARMIKEETA